MQARAAHSFLRCYAGDCCSLQTFKVYCSSQKLAKIQILHTARYPEKEGSFLYFFLFGVTTFALNQNRWENNSGKRMIHNKPSFLKITVARRQIDGGKKTQIPPGLKVNIVFEARPRTLPSSGERPLVKGAVYGWHKSGGDSESFPVKCALPPLKAEPLLPWRATSQSPNKVELVG